MVSSRLHTNIIQSDIIVMKERYYYGCYEISIHTSSKLDRSRKNKENSRFRESLNDEYDRNTCKAENSAI